MHLSLLLLVAERIKRKVSNSSV